MVIIDTHSLKKMGSNCWRYSAWFGSSCPAGILVWPHSTVFPRSSLKHPRFVVFVLADPSEWERIKALRIHTHKHTHLLTSRVSAGFNKYNFRLFKTTYCNLKPILCQYWQRSVKDMKENRRPRITCKVFIHWLYTALRVRKGACIHNNEATLLKVLATVNKCLATA